LRYYSQNCSTCAKWRRVRAGFSEDRRRLGLDGFDCADPYVERLLEGFSFLAARVQLKIDAEFPRFTQHLSELVYPHLLAPTPSMAVVQLQPDLSNPALRKGFVVARGSAMRSVLGKGDNTACEYRSGHDLTLWPLELVEARFFTHGGSQAGLNLQLPAAVKAGIRLRLRSSVPFSELPLERLCLHLRGADDMPVRIYEKMLGSVEGVLLTPVGRPAAWHSLLPKTTLQPLGFDERAALLPSGKRTFQGYRLLQEYFAFPQRFHFVELSGLQAGLRQCPDKEIEITILLNRADVQLEKTLDSSNFALHCTPVVNLFQRRADRINVSESSWNTTCWSTAPGRWTTKCSRSIR
jgi:type VI secretion system protein ImpG